jgi:hypothetical protein
VRRGEGPWEGLFGRRDIVKFVIAVIVGAVLGIVGTIAGVSAYQGNPTGDHLKLSSYADN